VGITTAVTMIKAQAIINPVGIAIGWVYSDEWSVLRAVFLSIAAGILNY